MTGKQSAQNVPGQNEPSKTRWTAYEETTPAPTRQDYERHRTTTPTPATPRPPFTPQQTRPPSQQPEEDNGSRGITIHQAETILNAITEIQRAEPHHSGFVTIEIRKGRLRRIYQTESLPLPPEPGTPAED